MQNENSNKRTGVNLQKFFSKKKDSKNVERQVEKVVEKNIEVKPQGGEKVIKIEKKKTTKTKEVKVATAPKNTQNTPILENPQSDFIFNHIDTVGFSKKDVLSKFVDWFLLPESLREPKTQKLFAEKYKVHEDSLTDWKKLAGFFDEVADRRNNIWRQKTSDVAYSLLEATKSGNPLAIKLWYQIFEKLSDKIDLKDNTPPYITPEQKAQIDFALKNIGMASIIKNNEQK